MSTSYGLSITVAEPFEDVLAAVRAALGEQGFGVVTEIDMAATLQNKIGAQIPAQIILGACSPRHAYRALQAEPSVGLLLPCNVVVRSVEAGTAVEAINPAMLVDLTSNPDMREVADEVTVGLQAMLDSVARAH